MQTEPGSQHHQKHLDVLIPLLALKVDPFQSNWIKSISSDEEKPGNNCWTYLVLVQQPGKKKQLWKCEFGAGNSSVNISLLPKVNFKPE